MFRKNALESQVKMLMNALEVLRILIIPKCFYFFNFTQLIFRADASNNFEALDNMF